jgi:hypothetical protein
MELRYGQAIQLRKDIDLSFYCDGILPAGQMGYQETHYKIKFDQATIILPQSLVSELFEEYEITSSEGEQVVEQVEELIEEVKEYVEHVEVQNDSIVDLTKLKKDELIQLVKTAFPDRDYSGLKKDELIEILEGPTDA